MGGHGVHPRRGAMRSSRASGRAAVFKRNAPSRWSVALACAAGAPLVVSCSASAPAPRPRPRLTWTLVECDFSGAAARQSTRTKCALHGRRMSGNCGWGNLEREFYPSDTATSRRRWAARHHRPRRNRHQILVLLRELSV